MVYRPEEEPMSTHDRIWRQSGIYGDRLLPVATLCSLVVVRYAGRCRIHAGICLVIYFSDFPFFVCMGRLHVTYRHVTSCQSIVIFCSLLVMTFAMISVTASL
jgi:hypothetical protein